MARGGGGSKNLLEVPADELSPIAELETQAVVWRAKYPQVPVFEGTSNAWIAYDALKAEALSMKRAKKRLGILKVITRWPVFELPKK